MTDLTETRFDHQAPARQNRARRKERGPSDRPTLVERAGLLIRAARTDVATLFTIPEVDGGVDDRHFDTIFLAELDRTTETKVSAGV